ncbi:MAG: hypothetical protein ACC648_10060 [Thiohalobacterales bacterium]
MHDTRMKKHGVLLATAALVTEMGIAGIATAADNPFRMTELAAGYQLAHQDADANENEQPAPAAKTEETGKGDPDHSMDEKKHEAEGKCGAEHKKLSEGKCGGSH